MRTVTFKSVLDGVATRMGLEPDSNLQLNQATALVEYITDRLQKCWERAAWPEWTTSELRQYRKNWDASAQYNLGDEVYYPTTNAYYRSIFFPNSGDPPDGDPTFWEVATDLDTYIALDQSWEPNAMGEVWGVWADDPRKTKSPRKVSWWLGPQGVWVDTLLTKVYPEFSSPAPAFTTALWDAALAYVPGDLVYDPATGDCYKAIAASTGVPPTTAASWKRQAFPKILSRAVKMAAIADALREDENLAKASGWDAQAEDALADALDRAMPAMRTQPSFSLGR